MSCFQTGIGHILRGWTSSTNCHKLAWIPAAGLPEPRVLNPCNDRPIFAVEHRALTPGGRGADFSLILALGKTGNALRQDEDEEEEDFTVTQRIESSRHFWISSECRSTWVLNYFFRKMPLCLYHCRCTPGINVSRECSQAVLVFLLQAQLQYPIIHTLANESAEIW